MINNIFFTSDNHFGHSSIIKYSNRPFVDVDEMNEVMIQNWNRTVGNKDLVFHLGDFAFLPEDEIRNTINRLNGNINFILGNHDRKLSKLKNITIINNSIHEMKIADQFVVMSHYPLLSWNRSFHGSFMLHGHCHGTARYPYPEMRIHDVGVDCNNFKPIEFSEIREMLGSRPSPKDLTGNMVVDGGP
jgi:calcineurin-like phosphoesterase family protein